MSPPMAEPLPPAPALILGLEEGAPSPAEPPDMPPPEMAFVTPSMAVLRLLNCVIIPFPSASMDISLNDRSVSTRLLTVLFPLTPKASATDLTASARLVKDVVSALNLSASGIEESASLTAEVFSPNSAVFVLSIPMFSDIAFVFSFASDVAVERLSILSAVLSMEAAVSDMSMVMRESIYSCVFAI